MWIRLVCAVSVSVLYVNFGTNPMGWSHSVPMRPLLFLLQLQTLFEDSELPQDATEKFQTLQRVYEVLSDEEKRRVYDQTGSLEDSVWPS